MDFLTKPKTNLDEYYRLLKTTESSTQKAFLQVTNSKKKKSSATFPFR